MTNDFDELISAYIDGATTPEETARVDADPELRAAAERLRALAGEVGRVPMPAPEVRSAHLSAALDAFDSLGEGDTDVVDVVDGAHGATTEIDGLASREATAAAAATVEDPTSEVASLDRQRARRRETAATDRPGGMPRWLGAAAAAVVVVGGLGVAFQAVGGGSDDADESAAVASESQDDEAAESSAESFEVTEADEAGDFEVAEEADDAMEDRSSLADLDDDATDEDAAADDGAEAATAEAEPATTTTGRDSPTTTPGLFPAEVEERRVDLDGPPGLDEQQVLLAENETLSPALSVCGESFDLGEPVGFLPLSVAGAPAELIVFLGADGAETSIAVDSTCLPF
ncbi:MAG: zf-HC2 domain-containing protein [Actinomycetota bacterium]